MPRRPRLALSTRADELDDEWDDAAAPSGGEASRRDALADATHRGVVVADDTFGTDTIVESERL